MEADSRLSYNQEPLARWIKEDLDQLLVWAVKENCSDVSLVPGRGALVRCHGEWYEATKHIFEYSEIAGLVDMTSNNKSASSRVIGGQYQDYSYEVHVDRVTRYRFRINACSCRDGWSDGISMVMRTNPSMPPTPADVGIDDELLDMCTHKRGLVLFTGVMGSGKTTSLAAILRHRLETERVNMQTFEEPIEFDLMNVKGKGFCVQHEIPRHLLQFMEAPRAAARKAADIVLMGEMRDLETMDHTVELADMGAAAYGTMHTETVAQTPSRLINRFPKERQGAIATSLISTLRVVVQQRLLPKQGGGRVALREVLRFTPEIRDELIETPHHLLIPVIGHIVQKQGRTLEQGLDRLYQDGAINTADYDRNMREILRVKESEKKK